MKAPRVSWERVARVLEREKVSDIDLAKRLECEPGFVARVRNDLRMPAFPVAPVTDRLVRPVCEIEWEQFEADSTVTPDGHRQWTGRRSADGTPIFSTELTAYRFAFRALHGEDPEGRICVECTYEQCVEGVHLSDRLMRERAQAVTG